MRRYYDFWIWIGVALGMLTVSIARAENRELPGEDCAGIVAFPPVQIVGDRTFFPEGTITIAPSDSPYPVHFFSRGRDAFFCARDLGWSVRVWHSGWKRVRSRDLYWK